MNNYHCMLRYGETLGERVNRTFWLAKTIILSNEIRIHLLRFLKPKKVNDKLIERKGKCLMCGICCGNCEYIKIIDQKNICSVYDKRCEFKIDCRTFPIDEKDKEIINKNCGYYWDNI